jgi:hypothetical protein
MAFSFKRQDRSVTVFLRTAVLGLLLVLLSTSRSGAPARRHAAALSLSTLLGTAPLQQQPRPPPEPLLRLQPQQQLQQEQYRRLSAEHRRVDLVFGVVAFDPAQCDKGACERTPYVEGVRRWVRSVRMHTDAANTEVTLLTAPGSGSIGADRDFAAWLGRQHVELIEADFRDTASRVAHGERRRFIWCVVRNRWSVIAQVLARRAGQYRYVLMSDTRDAVVQADPFAPARAALLDGAVVFSGEGSGRVRTLAQSRKGLPRTLRCARDATAAQRAMLRNTEPLNAGVTLADAAAFLNFSRALASLIARVTTAECLEVKACTDQGLYNVLVYTEWEARLPHTKRVLLPMERALSYTLGHRPTAPPRDDSGRLLNGAGELPSVVHQYGKGAAGKALRRTSFARKFLEGLREEGPSTKMRT